MADDSSGDVPSWLDFPLARPASEPEVPELLGAGFTHRGDGQYPVYGARGFEAGGPADLMPPCSVLAELTGQALDAGMDRLTDDELVGVLRAARRVASWQSAVELAAVEELAARRAAEPCHGGPQPAERASAELAVALTLTGRSADLLLELAAGIRRLPEVASSLARGELDLAKAAVFAAELAGLDEFKAALIVAAHLVAAQGLTTSQLRAVLRRAVLAADPEALQRRQREARRDARLEAWPESSGNIALAGRELPPDRALLADGHVAALARSLRAAGLPGTLEQVRAEVFLALLSGQSPDTLLPVGIGAERRELSVAATGTVNLTMPLTTWLGLTNRPGDVAGFGPADAWTCRGLAGAITGWPATRYCLTITTPAGHPLGHACTRVPPPGPAPPGSHGRDVVAWLGGLKVEWLQAGTCDHSRQTPAYTPTRRLDHLIKVRDPTCTAPGCRRSAQRCDIDHVTPFDQGGRTCECNCHPLCRRHHRCKQTTGWGLRMPEPGILTWTLPHGRSYTTAAEPYPV